jgi:hypothetical protein
MWIKQKFFLFLVLLSFVSCNKKIHSKSHNLTIITKFHEGDAVFGGKVLIVIDLLEDNDVIKFKQKDLKYESSTVFDGSTDLMHHFEEKEGIWEVKLDEGDFLTENQYQIEIFYNGTFPSEFIGKFEENFFIAMAFKSVPISAICPMIDVNKRSDFILEIKHHNSTHAISNGNPTVENDEENYFLVTKFSKLENFLPTSIAIFISNFESIESDEVKIFGNPKLIGEGSFNKSLELSTKVIEEFSNYFTHPLDKLTLIAVPGLISDISSHKLIYFNQFNLFHQQTQSTSKQIDKILQHLAHGVAVSL